MLFNSLSFIVFFAVVLATCRLQWSWVGKKAFLLAMSYVFYAAWNPPFVVILWISTVADWFFARLIHDSPTELRRRLCLAGTLLLNLGMLAYFKYAGFVLENLQALTQAVGVPWSPPRWSIVLPVGISFYTFQTLSYTLDVYRRRERPWRSFLDYALYVTFFPQLVAGPILRSGDFLPQCQAPRRANAAQLGWGLTLMVIGLFNKVVVADRFMAPVADRIFDGTGALTFSAAWSGTLAFTVQIFCDFAGYSTCAIGAALCLGFVLPDNFRFPYAAVGFSDFWRRWHISLSTWLRDYLYIPLGGNRQGSFNTYRNLGLTMLLGGLWHGASWTFVVWGSLHGLFLMAERAAAAVSPAGPRRQRKSVRAALALLTFAAICWTWVFFRAGTFGRAWQMCAAMAGQFGLGRQWSVKVLAATGVMLILHAWMRDSSLEARFRQVPAWVRVPMLAGMLVITLMLLAGGKDNAFIYFQF